MKTDTTTGPLLEVLASVLPCSPDEIAARAAKDSFVALGGNSVDAMDVAAKAEEQLGLIIDMNQLLGLAPLANVLTACVPGEPRAAAPERPAERSPQRRLPVVPEQEGFLAAERFAGQAAMLQVISGELIGPLDETALGETLDWVIARHEALRTVFEEHQQGYRRRVLTSWRPGLIRQDLCVADGDDPVETAHTVVAKGAGRLIKSTGRPAFAFVLTRFGERHHLLSLVIHHALADGWSAGLIWREIADHYAALRAGVTVADTPAPGPDVLLERRERLERAGTLRELAARRIAELDGFPTLVELPSDAPRPERFDFEGARLHFGLDARAREAVERLASQAKITHTSVLLAAWQLVIARRCGLSRFLMGISVANRGEAALMRLVAPCAALVPIRCELHDRERVESYLRGTAAAVAEGVAYAPVPLGEISRGVRAMANGRSVPLIQVVFSAQDAFLPPQLHAGDLTIRLHEAFSGRTAADASLFVLRWGSSPRLALEYATSVITPEEAAGLTEAFQATLLDLAEHYDDTLSRVRGMSARQRDVLDGWRHGRPSRIEPVHADSPVVDTESSLWHTFELRAAEGPDRPAIHEPARDLTLTYRELLDAAARQSARLAAAGVEAGDQVGIALPRSAEEIVAVLAALRIGASFVPLDAASPPARLARVLTTARPAAVIGTEPRLQILRGLLPPGCAALTPAGLHDNGVAAIVPPAPADPGRVAYTIFTSGSTGEPKGVRIRHGSALRLFGKGGQAPLAPGDRALRVGVLTFDISVVEIFNPLLSGATIKIYPDGVPHPSGLAAFCAEHQITWAIVPAPLFHATVEHRPDTFATLRHVQVGGDVVAPGPVRALLERYPGLIVSNSYGPTENSVVTTQHDMGDPCEVDDPLPIGGPIKGTGVVVLDENGGLVPPGGIGELCCVGDGLAVDYLGDPLLTETAFGCFDGERIYRSGDLVRWDSRGRLRFMGRADDQIKIRGYRIETGEVRARIGAHPAVADVVVAAVGGDQRSRRLLAAVVLREQIDDPLDELRRFAAEGLPRYMVPELWAIVTEMPVTANGKYDMRRLERLAIRAVTASSAESFAHV